MPAYPTSSINRNIPQASEGIPVYLLGSLNTLVAPTRMKVTAVQGTGAVTTLTVTVIGGNIPVAGQLITVRGVTPAGANVSSIAITSASFAVADNGVGTIVYPSTANAGPGTPSTGEAMAPQAAIGDALANGASQPVSLQSNTGPGPGFQLRADISFPSLPTTATVDLQTAMEDVDAQYTKLGNSVGTVSGGTLTGGTLTFNNVVARFARFNVSGVAGGSSPTIIGKVMVL